MARLEKGDPGHCSSLSPDAGPREASARPRRSAPDHDQKRHQGGQKGNRNALVGGTRCKRPPQDKHRRAALAWGKKARDFANVGDHPFGELAIGIIVTLQAIESRLRSRLDHRGYFTKNNAPQPALLTLIDVLDRLLGEARRLFDQLQAALPPPELTPREFHIVSVSACRCYRCGTMYDTKADALGPAVADDGPAPDVAALPPGAAQQPADAPAPSELTADAADPLQAPVQPHSAEAPAPAPRPPSVDDALRLLERLKDFRIPEA